MKYVVYLVIELVTLKGFTHKMGPKLLFKMM